MLEYFNYRSGQHPLQVRIILNGEGLSISKPIECIAPACSK